MIKLRKCAKTCFARKGGLRLLNSECGKIGDSSPVFRKKHTFLRCHASR